MSNNLMDYQELSALLGVKTGTLYSWVSRKRIPHIRLSGRLVRFDPNVITLWLTRRADSPVEDGEIDQLRPGSAGITRETP